MKDYNDLTHDAFMKMIIDQHKEFASFIQKELDKAIEQEISNIDLTELFLNGITPSKEE